MIRIQWSVLTDGGKSIVGYIVDWIVPGSSQFVRAPGGTIESDKIYWEIDLGRVLAGRIYRYRIQAVNSGGFISDYVYFEQLSSKGMYSLLHMIVCIYSRVIMHTYVCVAISIKYIHACVHTYNSYRITMALVD